MLDEIKIFQTEINSVIVDITRLESKTLKAPALEDRIRQCFVTWNRLKPLIESFGAQSAKVIQVDNLLELAARNSGKRIGKAKFRNQLRDANKILNIIYFDVVRTEYPSRPHRILEEIPDFSDDLIPKALLGWKSKIKDFLKRNPFDQNVFVMIRYTDQSAELLTRITATINEISDVAEKKFVPIVAKEHSITDDLYNPVACLLCCRYGVAVFDSVEEQPEFNPNVAYELGMMHLLQRKCLILKSTLIKTMPADILQKIYRSFSSPDGAAEEVGTWLRAQNT